MWFLNGLLLGILMCCMLFIYANSRHRKRRPRLLPPEHQRVEYKDGTISFYGRPGYQDIPCRIEIYHTYRYGYNANLRVVEEHSEIRRYCLNLPLPLALCTSDLFYKIIDSDGVSCMAYIGSQNTLVQA